MVWLERVIVAFEKEKNALYIRDMIEGVGLADVQLCRSGMEIRRLAGRESIQAVICGYKLPDGSAEALFEDLPTGLAMLMIATRPQLELCVQEGIFTLAAPIGREELLDSLRTVLQLSRSAEHPVPAQRATAQEGLIQRAKALLMTRQGMDEEEAHRLLQKRSMDRGCKLEEMAARILRDGG